MNQNRALEDNSIWTLIRSGFLLKLDGKVLIFDYSLESGGIALGNGVLQLLFQLVHIRLCFLLILAKFRIIQ